MKLTVIEKVTSVIILVIIALLCMGQSGCEAAPDLDAPVQWEVRCFSETGIRLVVDTLPDGQFEQDDGTVKYFSFSDSDRYEADAIYTGNCRAKKISAEDEEVDDWN